MIVSDADPQLPSKFWKQTLKTTGIKHIMAAPGQHQTHRQAEQKISELKTLLRNIANVPQTYWLISLPGVAAYSDAGHSDTINMSLYQAVYGRDHPLLNIYQVYPSLVRAPDDYYNRNQEIRDVAYQALSLARVRSSNTATRGRDNFQPVEIGGMLMIFGDQLATKSGRSRKLQACWRGRFIVVKFNAHTRN